MLKGQIQRPGAATAGHNGHARTAVLHPSHRLHWGLHPRRTQWLRGGARYIFQKIKKDFGVRWRGKEIGSKLYLKRVIQDVLLTRSLHFIKTVRTIVCDTQSAGDQLRLNKRIRTNRSLWIQSVSLWSSPGICLGRTLHNTRLKYNMYIYEGKYEKPSLMTYSDM